MHTAYGVLLCSPHVVCYDYITTTARRRDRIMIYDLRTASAHNDAIMLAYVNDDDVIGDVILFTMNIDPDDGDMTYAILRDDDGTPIVYSVENGAPEYSDSLLDVIDSDDYTPLPDDVDDLARRIFC